MVATTAIQRTDSTAPGKTEDMDTQLNAAEEKAFISPVAYECGVTDCRTTTYVQRQ